jgi:hypothetical protein
MAVKNSGDALLHLRTLFDVGAIGTLSDGQLLERFATGRGVPRELAFAALARKAGSLRAQDSLAPWLHQAAYRTAVYDRSAAIRRRSHEHAAAALRRESVVPPHRGDDDDLAKIIHDENYRRSPEIHVPEQGQTGDDGRSGRGGARGRCRRSGPIGDR